MTSVTTLKELIDKLEKENLELKEIKKHAEIVKNKINDDFNIIFNKTNNVSIFHDIVKEIGYIIGIINLAQEGLFDYNNVLREILIHFKKIDQFYSKHNLSFNLN
ncbi:MAG: hypothetical protein ACTSUG_14750 [Candidatus Helarchaeota archaeon]